MTAVPRPRVLRPRVLTAIAIADFRERVRRPAYAVMLAAVAGLGYLAAPGVHSRWAIVNAGDGRGVYNSPYIGTVTALAGALWLMIGGFYLVRGTIARDERTRVGELLAATPLTRAGYLVGKFLSNVLLLASLAGLLAVMAAIMQLARGESHVVDPFALLLPFLLLSFPMLMATAAAAILFDTVPGLRGGFGNVVWFFCAMVAAIGLQGSMPHSAGSGSTRSPSRCERTCTARSSASA